MNWDCEWTRVYSLRSHLGNASRGLHQAKRTAFPMCGRRVHAKDDAEMTQVTVISPKSRKSSFAEAKPENPMSPLPAPGPPKIRTRPNPPSNQALIFKTDNPSDVFDSEGNEN